MALTFVFAELPVVAEGWALLGAATGQLPFGRCVALETSNTFTALVGGDVAVFAVRVRFFQRQGYDAAAAVSAGAIATTASWTVKGLLFLIALPFAAASFQAPSGSGGHQAAVWIILQDQAVAAVLIQRFFTSYLPRCGDGRPWPGCAAANTYEHVPLARAQRCSRPAAGRPPIPGNDDLPGRLPGRLDP